MPTGDGGHFVARHGIRGVERDVRGWDVVFVIVVVINVIIVVLDCRRRRARDYFRVFYGRFQVIQVGRRVIGE